MYKWVCGSGLVIGSFLMTFAGCLKSETAPENKMESGGKAESSNQQILDEVNAGGTWFHAKKVRPIWAKEVQEQQKVATLEGEETVNAGDYLCRGEIGEVWPQSAKSLNSKYDATDEVDSDGWRKLKPKEDAKGVMAAQVDHDFKVQASWGELSGKPGDYIVKNYDDKDAAYPADVWIVDQNLFQATYRAVSR